METEDLTDQFLTVGIRKGTLDTLKRLKEFLKTNTPTNQEIIDNFIVPELEKL